MGFFISDLHQHIKQLHSEQFGGHQSSDVLTVYRGQSLSKTDFDQLVKTKGGLISFNNFLSTRKDRDMSLTYSRKGLWNPDIMGILFVITIDSSQSTTPFASINDVSCFQEDEVLFSMHSVFRVREMKSMGENNRLWQVDLTLTSDNDQELRILTEHMREETNGPIWWDRLGRLLLKVGQPKQAQEIYEVILGQTTDDYLKGSIYFGTWNDQGEYVEAITFYEKSREITPKIGPSNHSNFAAVYESIGNVYSIMGEYSKALSSHEKALEIFQKSLPPNHPDLGHFHNNIGNVYNSMGEYSKALPSYEKALEIQRESLPLNHPDLASLYNNIGNAYNNMGDYSKALSSHEKALEIRQKSLPPHHPNLASSYNNIGVIYKEMGEYSKALSFYERAVDIGQCSLPANHPDLQGYRRNLDIVKKKF